MQFGFTPEVIQGKYPQDSIVSRFQGAPSTEKSRWQERGGRMKWLMSEKGSREAASGVRTASVRALEMQTALGLASLGLARVTWREACWKGSPI